MSPEWTITLVKDKRQPHPTRSLPLPHHDPPISRTDTPARTPNLCAKAPMSGEKGEGGGQHFMQSRALRAAARTLQAAPHCSSNPTLPYPTLASVHGNNTLVANPTELGSSQGWARTSQQRGGAGTRGRWRGQLCSLPDHWSPIRQKKKKSKIKRISCSNPMQPEASHNSSPNNVCTPPAEHSTTYGHDVRILHPLSCGAIRVCRSRARTTRVVFRDQWTDSPVMPHTHTHTHTRPTFPRLVSPHRNRAAPRRDETPG